MVAQKLREYDQARDYYQQALEIKIEFGDRYSCASIYHQLGRVAQELREYDQARDYYQQALEITIEFGDRYSCASIISLHPKLLYQYFLATIMLKIYRVDNPTLYNTADFR